LSNKYNTVITVDLLHHVTNIKKTIYNIRKSLIDGGHWIIVEPNIYNPYIFLLQKFMEDERIFLQNKFELYIKEHFILMSKQNRVLIPHFIKKPPQILTFIESKFETLPFLGGDVVYLLKKIN
jgi:2-polyprenyl-3-methyl-5-hydroxy-6-metoxy-1,4-benzoquinol methylase